MLLSSRRLAIFLSSISAMAAVSSSVSALKTTNSSRRFRNSGRYRSLMAAMTRLFTSRLSPATSRMRSLPTLLVKTTMQLRKLTVSPFESVSRPSSSSCSIRSKTSPCAFSISSKSTTLYGRRRTASVSCPPSSKPT